MSKPSFLLTCLLLAAALALEPTNSPPSLLRSLPQSAPTPVASYAIDVRLDVEAKTLAAHETITYVNTTRTPIPDLVFHLYLNAFRDSKSLFLKESGVTHRGFGWDSQNPGWVKVDRLQLKDGSPLSLQEIEDGTLAQAGLPAPVAPGESVEIELDFHAQLPRVFARTGFADDFFMVGQWFPKLGVWQAGEWNAYPFHANSEFYADFGVYDVTITLPKDYVIGGTGLPVSTTENADGTQTIHYHAESVIDFAWTASPYFQPATRTVNGVEILYLYLPEHAWSVDRLLNAAEAALSHYTEWYGPYPYQRLTLVDAPDNGQGAGGMEYPTLATVGALDWTGLGLVGGNADRTLEAVAIHEIGHQWWQSMVAFNEAEEPWLDEGFTDYSTLEVMEALYGADTSFVDSPVLQMGYLDLRRAEYLAEPRVPMYGRAWEFREFSYNVAAYSKPVLALRTLKNVLGEAAMQAVMRTFFQRYQFAHPTTEDFRAVAQEVSGQDLAWFFEGLVYADSILNYTVTEVDEHTVTVARQGELAIPTEVSITFADGSAAREPWNGKEETLTLVYDDRPPVQAAEVDPDH